MAGGHNMFLKLTGEKTGVIKGEATEPEHEREIAVIDWGWGMTSPSAVGGMYAARRTRYEVLYIVKQADTASTALMVMMRQNEMGNAELSVRKAGGDAIDYFVVKMKSTRIVNFKIDSAINGEGNPCLTERFEFAFPAIEIEYRAQSDTGGAEGTLVFDDIISDT